MAPHNQPITAAERKRVIGDTPMMPSFLTMPEVCAMLKISRATAQRMVIDGRLPKPTKLGRSRTALIRFSREKVEAAIASLTAE